jgi:hypothetical protein
MPLIDIYTKMFTPKWLVLLKAKGCQYSCGIVLANIS